MNNKKLKILNPIMFVVILIAIIAIVTYKISEAFNYDAYGFKEIDEICGFLFVILAREFYKYHNPLGNKNCSQNNDYE